MTKGGSMKGTSHGMSRTPEYSVWQNMKYRCLNPRCRRYKNYGGRGIRVCDKWLTFTGFIADMGIRPTAKHSIERLDNNAGYHLANCVWATRQEQQRNTRIYRNNTTGLPGVYREKNRTCRAWIWIDGKQIHLGSYKTLFDAACARKSAEARYWQS